MRIRRNASKLLGSASAAAYSNPPPAPAGTAAAEPEEEFTVCELNRSPWDAMDINLCNFFANPKEEDGGGILGNSYRTEVKEPISAIASTAAAELTPTEMKEIESKKANRKERKKVCKGKETLVADTERVTYCKKSDGKGWHCKRLAQLPSSFCSYHLAQIRSYSSNHRHRAAADASAAATGNGKNLHAKPAAVGETCVTSNFYYYYNGFGPWRSKRRGKGGVNGTCGGNVMEEEVKEDMDRKESVNHDDDDDDNVVAGDDEYDLDCFDGDEDDDDNLYSMPLENEEKGKKTKGGETEKMKVLKKRGRKPFKCRSLKSLL